MIRLLAMEHLVLNNSYSVNEQKEMLAIASTSIHFGLKNHQRTDVNQLENFNNFQQQRATFVTLEINGRLRGCIGSLLAYRPLAEDISANAFAAAFEDPRFNPLTLAEYEQLDIHISILSPPETMTCVSEESLLKQIQVGIDGIILTDMGHRATFLPSVWDSLPDKKDFLSHLKQKAGLSTQHWSNTIQVERYATFSFGNTTLNILA